MAVITQNKTTINAKLVCVGGTGDRLIKKVGDQLKAIKKDLQISSHNTDFQSQVNLKEVDVFTLSPDRLGSGGNPEVAFEFASRHEDEYRKYFEGTDIVYIAAGLGKGTGTGASLYLATLLRQMGIYTVGIFRKPSILDGKKRKAIADEYLPKIAEQVSAYTVIDNEIVESLALQNEITNTDNALNSGLVCMTDTIVALVSILEHPGIKNVDLEDFKSRVNGLFATTVTVTSTGDVTTDLSMFGLNSLDAKTCLVVAESKGESAVNDFVTSRKAIMAVQEQLNDDVDQITGYLVDPDLSDDQIRVIFITSRYTDKNCPSFTRDGEGFKYQTYLEYRGQVNTGNGFSKNQN